MPELQVERTYQPKIDPDAPHARSGGRGVSATTRPEYPMVEPDGRISRFVAVDDLDLTDYWAYRRACPASLVTGSDGRLYFDLADLDERWRQ